MTSFYKIVSSAGLDMGIFEAESPEAALDAMARDAGYKSHAEALETTGERCFDGSVTEVDTAGVDRLRNTKDSDLYSRRVVSGVECYDLTEAGSALAESLGLTVDVDAYGCAFVRDL